MLTFGIEEEFMWLDKCGKRSAVPPFEKWTSPTEKFSLNKETHLGVVEIASTILSSFRDVSHHCKASRAWLEKQAKTHDAAIFAGGTHPTLDWKNEPLVDTQYHQKTVARYGDVLKRGLVFGMHGHIGGIGDKDTPRVFNTLRPYLPILLAMGANSRRFGGRDTNMACYRMTAFSSLPRTGIPDPMLSTKDELDSLDHLVKANVLERPTEVWFDARYHPTYRTIEIRNMDMQPTSALSSAMAIFMFALVEQIHRENPLLPDWQMPTRLIEENRWLAMRDGAQAKFFNNSYEQISFENIIKTLLFKMRHRIPVDAMKVLCQHFNVELKESVFI